MIQHKTNFTMWRSSVFVAFAVIAATLIAACGVMPVADKNGRVYHCVATARLTPPTNTFSIKLPLEKFEYGDYKDENRPTISGSGYCSTMAVPSTAYLRYRVDGKVVEKRFDLSSLNPSRVHKKTVEFYVDGEVVEVRLVTPVDGNWPKKEVIVRQ